MSTWLTKPWPPSRRPARLPEPDIAAPGPAMAGVIAGRTSGPLHGCSSCSRVPPPYRNPPLHQQIGGREPARHGIRRIPCLCHPLRRFLTTSPASACSSRVPQAGIGQAFARLCVRLGAELATSKNVPVPRFLAYRTSSLGRWPSCAHPESVSSVAPHSMPMAARTCADAQPRRDRTWTCIFKTCA